jgi:hypothetical protein
MRVAGLASDSARVWSVGSRAACGGTLRGEGCGTALLTTGRPLIPAGKIGALFPKSFRGGSRRAAAFISK